MMRASLVFAGMLFACGPKKSDPAPVQPLPGNATTPVPGMATGATVQLACKGLNPTPCQTPDFNFNATYDTPNNCRVNMNNANEFTFDMRTNKPNSDERILVSIKNFRGAGTYELNDKEHQFVGMTATIHREAGQCGGGSAGAALQSPKYSCGACQVVVTDPSPNAPYPKPLTLSISCSKMCAEDSHVCGGINMQLTQTCTN